jgi:hypothetical protein
MSITQALQALQQSRELTPWKSPRSRRTARRRLYLTMEALRDLQDPASAINLLAWNKGRTRGLIEAALDRWVLGDLVYLNKKRRYMCRLDPPPPEIWEVRVTEPQPQVRLFGRFIEPDTFIITKFRSRTELGDKGSRAWESAMRDCARRWTQLFPTISPYTANTVHEYITENCDDYGPECHPTKRTGSGRIRRRKNKK